MFVRLTVILWLYSSIRWHSWNFSWCPGLLVVRLLLPFPVHYLPLYFWPMVGWLYRKYLQIPSASSPPDIWLVNDVIAYNYNHNGFKPYMHFYVTLLFKNKLLNFISWGLQNMSGFSFLLNNANLRPVLGYLWPNVDLEKYVQTYKYPFNDFYL
jgi:hypothetical protein